MTQKLNPFPLHLTSCHLISQRRLRTSILSLVQYFSPVDAENTSMGREGVMPGWTWAPQGIERCLWQEAVYSSVPNSCCLQLFPSFSTPLSIICELREKPQNWLQTAQKPKGARSVEFHIRSSVEEAHTRTNSKGTLIFWSSSLKAGMIIKIIRAGHPFYSVYIIPPKSLIYWRTLLKVCKKYSSNGILISEVL